MTSALLRTPRTQPSLFERLSPERRARLLSGAQEIRYGKGAVLFRQGQESDAVWLVLEGWVHLLRWPDGLQSSRAVAIFTVTPQEAICGVSSLSAGSYNLSAVAGTACRTLRIPAEAFREAVASEPAFAQDVLRLCVRRLQKIAEQYGAMAEPVSYRLVRSILRLQEQFGRTIPMTHRELAQMSWTTTETAIRVVRRLKRQGWVGGGRGRLVVRKPQALSGQLRETPNGRFRR